MENYPNFCPLFVVLGRLASKCCHPTHQYFVKSTLQKQGPFTGATCIASPSYKEVWLFLVLSPVDFLCTNLLLKHCRTINVWESGNIRNTCKVFPVAVTPQYRIGSKEESNALVLSLAKICPSQESSLRSCWGSLLLWQRSSCSYFSTEGKYWLKVTVLAYFQNQLFSLDLCKEQRGAKSIWPKCWSNRDRKGQIWTVSCKLLCLKK